MNTVYGPNMAALIQTCVARGWVDWRDTQDALWKRVEIETACLFPAAPDDTDAGVALGLIRRADLLMLGLA